jgi:hypothetical protein
LTSLLLAILLAATVRVSCSNFSADIYGDPDTRPGTWGRAGAEKWEIRFVQPVKIQRVYGDLLAWPKGEVPRGAYYGVLMGLGTNQPDGSAFCDWCADNVFFYIQGAGSRASPVVRIPFDTKLNLEGFHDMITVKVAAFLNDTGREIHIEPTFCLEYIAGPRGQGGGGQ